MRDHFGDVHDLFISIFLLLVYFFNHGDFHESSFLLKSEKLTVKSKTGTLGDIHDTNHG